jgi:hypothetical protein
MIGIYKILSPSGKIYIGQSINMEKRKSQYIKLNKSCIGPKLYNSLIKYGWESHIYEILEECPVEYLNEREIFYKQQIINKYGWELSLFCEIYDMGGGPKSEKTKQKQSISHKIHLSKPEIKEKRKINCKLAANKPGVQEKAVNNTDWKKREINRILSMDYSKLKKSVLQYDLEGNFIKKWNGFIDIKNELNYDQSTIRKCCKNIKQSAYGYKWKYE